MVKIAAKRMLIIPGWTNSAFGHEESGMCSVLETTTHVCYEMMFNVISVDC